MELSLNLKTKAARMLAAASLAGPLAGCAWFAPNGEPPAMPSPAHTYSAASRSKSPAKTESRAHSSRSAGLHSS